PSQNRVDRPARVDDVLDQQDVAALQRSLHHVGDLHPAGGPGPAPVAGGAHELELCGDGKAAQQVGGEDCGALQDGDDDQRSIDVRVHLGDLAAELAHAPGDAL